MKTVSFLSLKGGVGKSTLAILIAFLLSYRKHKVLVIDLDIQNSTTYRFDKDLVLADTKNIAHVFMDPTKILDNIINVAPGIDLIPSSMNLIQFGTLPIKTLRLILKKLDGVYDFVVLDTAPSWDAIVRTAFEASSLIISPVEPSEFNLKTVRTMRDSYDMENEEKLNHWTIVPTNFNLSLVRHKELLKAYEEEFKNTSKIVIPATENVAKMVEGKELRKNTDAYKNLELSLEALINYIEQAE